MNTPTKLGAYAAGLVLAFAAAAGLGSAVRPVGAAANQVEHHEGPIQAPADAGGVDH